MIKFFKQPKLLVYRSTPNILKVLLVETVCPVFYDNFLSCRWSVNFTYKWLDEQNMASQWQRGLSKTGYNNLGLGVCLVCNSAFFPSHCRGVCYVTKMCFENKNHLKRFWIAYGCSTDQQVCYCFIPTVHGHEKTSRTKIIALVLIFFLAVD